MVGIKLLHLYNELNATQINELKMRCAVHQDKRYRILAYMLEKPVEDPEELLVKLRERIEYFWPNSPDNDLKFRRISMFVASHFESVIIDSYLHKETAEKSALLARAVEKRGNLLLMQHYYNKVYQEGKKSSDRTSQIRGLNGKLRMSYASQNEKDLEDALRLNEELLESLNLDYQSKLVDYYYNSSNIYLEQNVLLAHKKEQLCDAIKDCLSRINHSVFRASLFLSLAKFNYNNSLLNEYLELANDALLTVKEKDKAYWDLQRKIKFLELRLHFFSGKDLEYLMDLSDNVVDEFVGYSIINNNVLFYKILFLILKGELAVAQNMLKESNIYFQGDSVILKQFLLALLQERLGEDKKALQLLNQLIYTDNYLVAIFSRLLYIRILLRRERSTLLKTTIQSTQRILKKNQHNPLGKEAHQSVLSYFKKMSNSSKKINWEPSEPLTVLHTYLVSGT